MNEPKNGISEDVQRVINIFSVKEHIVDKDLEKLESRLNDRIIDFEKDVTQVKADLEKDIREVQIDLRDDIKGIRSHITVLTVLDVTSLLTLIGLIITVLVK